MTHRALPIPSFTETECGICFDRMNNNVNHPVHLHEPAKTSEPFHTICQQCTQELLKQSSECPICKTALNKDQLQKALTAIQNKIRDIVENQTSNTENQPQQKLRITQRLGQSLERKMGRLLDRLHLRRNQPNGAQATAQHATSAAAHTPQTNTELSAQDLLDLEATRDRCLQRINSINQELIQLATQDLEDNGIAMNSVIAFTQELDECRALFDVLSQHLDTHNSTPRRAAQATSATPTAGAPITPTQQIVLM